MNNLLLLRNTARSATRLLSPTRRMITSTSQRLPLSAANSSSIRISTTSVSNKSSRPVASVNNRITAKGMTTTTSTASYCSDASLLQEPTVLSLFEERTGTWQYIVADPLTRKAAIIDAVLDYDPATHTISTKTADGLLSTIKENRFHVEKILETHAHADHLTAAAYLQQRLAQAQGSRPPICIGKRIRQVQDHFGAKYGIPAQQYEGVFDKLFEDDETFDIGNLEVKVVHLPGHTPDHIGYQIGDNVFCGDSIFHADIGTARCDFPGGSAESLYTSAQKLLSLPEDFKIWTGHDYPACPERCDAVPWMTVRDHREKNKHLSSSIKEDDFLTLRKERDAALAAPKLLDASLQFNIRAGRLPRPTDGGERLLHFPVKLDGAKW